jgi:hypothetical protein
MSYSENDVIVDISRVNFEKLDPCDSDIYKRFITDDYGFLLEVAPPKLTWRTGCIIAERTKHQILSGKKKYVCLNCGLESNTVKFGKSCLCPQLEVYPKSGYLMKKVIIAR